MGAEPFILIADETLEIQAQLGDGLGDYGTLMSAMNQEQLDYWVADRDAKPDILLLDQAFVGQQMQRFCTSWKENPKTRDIPLIAIGGNDDELELRALSAGAADYFRKPLNIELCITRIRMQLAAKQEVRRLEALSMTDGLTQVANRRYFDDFLQAEWRRAAREGSNVGLIMLDIDHFKLFNDQYGHLEGDACLRRIAHCIRDQVQRPRDLVARYGGEEFVMVLPSIHFEGIRVVADRVQMAIQNLKIPHETSPTSTYLTVSMGLAWTEPSCDDDLTTLIEAADEALYSAKASGRNCYSRPVDLARVKTLLTSKNLG